MVSLARTDARACVVLIAVAAAIAEAGLFLRPDLSRTAAFLFGDNGFALLVAREVLHGARLYTDVAYQYGFVPVYLYAGVAAVFGNTPLVYLHVLLVCSLLNLAMFYALARRAAGPGLAFVVSLFGALPVLLVPGALLGGFVSSYYIPIERGLMLAAAVAWQPTSQRSGRRTAALGACLGLMQCVRFGPAIVLAAAIVLIDAAVHLAGRRPIREWLVADARMLGVAAAIEATRIAVAFAVLPHPIAIDVVWPVYILPAYAGVVRHPGWHGWAMGIGQFFNPLASIALTCAGAASLVRYRRLASEDASQLILPLFLAAGVCGLFRSEFHYYQAAWMLTPGSLLALRRWPATRVLAVAAWLPPFGLVATLPLRPPPGPVTTMTIADGWRLTVPVELEPRIDGLVGALRGTRERVVLYPGLSGLNVALDLPLVSRESFFMPTTVRPYEVTWLVREFAQAGTFVTCRDTAAWTTSPGLFNADVPPAVRAAIEPRAGAVRWQDESCRVLALRPGPR